MVLKMRTYDECIGKMYQVQKYSFETGKGIIYGGIVEYELDNVMLYTGLNDKNDTEIYQDDIVRVFDNVDKYYVGKVVMSNLGVWSVLIDNLEVPLFDFINDTLCLVHNMSRIEVIGNIYQNEDLLK